MACLYIVANILVHSKHIPDESKVIYTSAPLNCHKCFEYASWTWYYIVWSQMQNIHHLGQSPFGYLKAKMTSLLSVCNKQWSYLFCKSVLIELRLNRRLISVQSWDRVYCKKLFVDNSVAGRMWYIKEKQRAREPKLETKWIWQVEREFWQTNRFQLIAVISYCLFECFCSLQHLFP